MRILLIGLLWLFAHSAQAGYASAAIGGGATKASGGTWSVQGASATAANGAFNTPATVQAAGKAVTMPASATFAANAASFAVGAVRLNPTGLFIGAVVPWLLNEGLQWIDGAWRKTIPAGYEYSMFEFAGFPDAWGERTVPGCDSFRAWYRTNYSSAFTAAATVMTIYTTGGAQGYGYCHLSASGNTVTSSYKRRGTAASSQPATDADFVTAGTHAIPDSAAQELARANVPMPVSEPVLAPTPQVVDYGAPYVDPATGKTVQMKTRITPDPTAANPQQVRLDSYAVEVAPAPTPNPADPVPVPADEQPKDPCLDNPDRLGCLRGGSPEDVTLQEYSVPFSVTPVTVGGPGTCPPNPTFQAAGRTFTINYTPMCNAATWLKPLILAMAWLAAAMIIAGTVRES